MRSIGVVLCLVLLASCTSGGDERRAAEPVERRALSGEEPACGNIDEQLRRVRRGWVPVRAVDISLLPREPNYIGPRKKPVHTGPFDFLADVPLVLYGPGHIEPVGEVGGPATMADVAPTIARLVGFDDYRAPDGDALTEALSGSDPPRLVLTVVWDGGGWNTFDEHPSRWPFLERLMRRGVSYTDFEIGSTPSNTPPIHTTLGTGAFPRHHGIPAVKIETSEGDYIDPYEGNDADLVRIPTLGDLYDRALDNEPLVGVVATVNWHLGMIGHGAAFEGGDRDLALLMNDRGEPYGNAAVYEVPPGAPGSLDGAADDLDARDGSRDGTWEGRDLGDPAVRYGSPAYVAYQAQVLASVIATEGFGADDVPDLLFSNFKSLDDAGHRWGMTSEETGEVLAATDAALRTVVRSLNRNVGEGEWVVIVTADHGQNVYPEESGAWPISGGELKSDANEALDARDDGVDLVTRVTSAGAFVDEEQIDANGLSLRRIARWMSRYRVGENVRPGGRLPREWRDRAGAPLFDAAVPGNGAPILICAP